MTLPVYNECTYLITIILALYSAGNRMYTTNPEACETDLQFSLNLWDFGCIRKTTLFNVCN